MNAKNIDREAAAIAKAKFEAAVAAWTALDRANPMLSLARRLAEPEMDEHVAKRDAAYREYMAALGVQLS